MFSSAGVWYEVWIGRKSSSLPVSLWLLMKLWAHPRQVTEKFVSECRASGFPSPTWLGAALPILSAFMIVYDWLLKSRGRNEWCQGRGWRECPAGMERVVFREPLSSASEVWWASLVECTSLFPHPTVESTCDKKQIAVGEMRSLFFSTSVSKLPSGFS